MSRRSTGGASATRRLRESARSAAQGCRRWTRLMAVAGIATALPCALAARSAESAPRKGVPTSAAERRRVLPLPGVRVGARRTRFDGHQALIVRSIIVSRIGGVKLSISCGGCQRYPTPVRRVWLRRGVERFSGVDWIVLVGRDIRVSVSRHGRIGRYLLLGVGAHRSLVYEASGCLSAKRRPAACPRGTKGKARGVQVAGGAPGGVQGMGGEPVTSILTHPASLQTAVPVGFTYSSSIPDSVFQCSLDGSSWSACPSSGIDYATVAEGQHSFAVRAISPAGATSSTPASFAWTQDNPPATTITGGPAGTVTASTASFTYASDKSGSSFLCRLDGAAWSSCPAGGVSYEGLANARHVFEVRAVDRLGASDPVGASRVWDQVDRYGVTSYDRMAPGAPHHGQFIYAFQAFTAESNTITLLGVTVGNVNLPAGVPVGFNVLIRLCTNQPDATGNCNVIAQASPQVVNYGDSAADIGEVGVSIGTTYWIVYYPPQPYGNGWVTYWWEGGSSVESSEAMQAIVQGYDR